MPQASDVNFISHHLSLYVPVSTIISLQERWGKVSFSDKQELIAMLGIMVYPSEDHKTVRITSKLPILGDRLSYYKISIASPILIIPREFGDTQSYLEISVSCQS
ncbi:MAG: hypothetical protein KAV87_62815 [Desulfobacteraceae bacterium]|nr:hypothetical protein [Desulfobacteraceae bacterium]